MNEARNRDLDALGMYNLTLQANSWDDDDDDHDDGRRSFYGQRVAIVQAMMVCKKKSCFMFMFVFMFMFMLPPSFLPTHARDQGSGFWVYCVLSKIS